MHGRNSVWQLMYFDSILSDASASAALGYIRYSQGFIADNLLFMDRIECTCRLNNNNSSNNLQ